MSDDPILDLVRRAQARRLAAGLAVPYVRRCDGVDDVMYCANEAGRVTFLTKCAVNGTKVLLPDFDRKALLAAEYVARIGYNPFEDCPSITEDEVAQILIEYDQAERREAGRR